MRLDIRRIGAIKEASKDRKGEMSVVGNRTRIKVVKNKMAPPFREVELDILYGQGMSHSGEVLDMAANLDIVQKSGAWYSLDGERIGQGRDNARQYLEENLDLMRKIENKVREYYKVPLSAEPKPSAENDETADPKAEATVDSGSKKSKTGAVNGAAKAPAQRRGKDAARPN